MSSVRGIWNEAELSNEKFARFFALVQEAADEQGCVFFTWAGEGNELFSDSLEGEDMSGWLVPASEADRFERQWSENRHNLDSDADDWFCFAEWSKGLGGSIDINFKAYI